jgi:peptidoglycan/LPS O-acetylase OafA/YrhL
MRIKEIQGLRAFAVVLVLLYHAKFLSGGFIGVDIFYVISGYLITGLITKELENSGSIDLFRFYNRRIKRLLPASFFVLFATALIAWFVYPSTSRNDLGKGLFAAGTYTSNYLFAWWGNDYQHLNAKPSPFIHFWSLAVEEQFYLIWPVLLLIASKFGKKLLPICLITVTALSFIFSIYLTNTAPIWAFYSLPTRAWELGIGALLLFIPRTYFSKRNYGPIASMFLLGSAILMSEKTAFPGWIAMVPVAAVALLIATISTWSNWLTSILNSRLSQWIGGISYPLYLWHWPLLVLPSSYLGRSLTVIERILCIAATVLAAAFTHRFIEEPLRSNLFSVRKTITIAMVATASVIVLACAITASTTTFLTSKGNVSLTFDLETLQQSPQVYKDGCHLTFNQSESGICTYGDKKSPTRIMLFGDSHAAQWFPALESIAKRNNYALISLTKASCPSVEVIRADLGAFKMNYCKKWRTSVLAQLKKIKPTIIIVSNFEHYDSGKEPFQLWWSKGVEILGKDLSRTGAQLVYLRDTPQPSQDIPTCISIKNSSKCTTHLPLPVTIESKFSVIDPTPWLCTTDCPAIINGTVVYRDALHISVEMSRKLAPVLEKALKDNTHIN